MDLNVLFSIYKKIPLANELDDTTLCKAILALDIHAHEAITVIILRYFMNNPNTENIRIVDVAQSIERQGQMQLPYGGISRGIGVTFLIKKLPTELLCIIKAYISLISELA